MYFGSKRRFENTVQNVECRPEMRGLKSVCLMEKEQSIHSYHRGRSVAVYCWFGGVGSQKVPRFGELLMYLVKGVSCAYQGGTPSEGRRSMKYPANLSAASR